MDSDSWIWGVWPFPKKRNGSEFQCRERIGLKKESNFLGDLFFFSVSGLKKNLRDIWRHIWSENDSFFSDPALDLWGSLIWSTLKMMAEIFVRGPFDFFWPRSTGLGKLQRRDLAEVVLEYCRCGWLEFCGEHLWWKKTCPTFWVGEKPIESGTCFSLPKKVISGKIYSESYFVYVNLQCRLALFRTRPNIYLSIDSRFQFLTSPAKRLIFTGVWIVGCLSCIFHALVHIFSIYKN